MEDPDYGELLLALLDPLAVREFSPEIARQYREFLSPLPIPLNADTSAPASRPAVAD